MQERFFERDLSWLSFNHRVLQEARDSRAGLIALRKLSLRGRFGLVALVSPDRVIFFSLAWIMDRRLGNGCLSDPESNSTGFQDARDRVADS